MGCNNDFLTTKGCALEATLCGNIPGMLLRCYTYQNECCYHNGVKFSIVLAI